MNSGLPTNPDGTYAAITVLAIDPQNPSTVYAAKPSWVPGERRDFADVGAPVFKTTDGGASWSAASSGLPSNIFGIAALVIDPQNPSTVYVAIRIQDFPFTGARADLFTSTDGGDSWSAASSGLPANYAERLLAIDPQNPSILYAPATLCRGDCDSHVFKSADGGRTWNALPFSFRSNGNYWGSIITSLAVDPQNSATVYVVVDEMNDLGRISKSTDGGTSWNWITGSYTSFTFLAVDPKNSTTLYAGTTGGVGQSTDGGTSWSLLRAAPDKTFFSSLVIDPQNPSTVYAGTSGGGVFAITFAPDLK